MSSDDDQLSVLITKCKSASDIDIKLDAVAKLQEQFQKAVEINDVNGVISALKSCLRTPNQHLSTATLSAIVPLVPLLITPRPSFSPGSSSSLTNDFSAFRQALNAFLPSGGVFERLGDNREKARERAKETIIAIGSCAIKINTQQSSSLRSKEAKSSETPFQLFERYMKEQGLLSKSWRVKEQSLLCFVQLRRTYPQFPLRPFLPALVDALEDSDGTVRDCAKQSIIEIFTGTSVSDAARTDLKREMAKKNVRKAIVDGLMLRILTGESKSTPPRDDHLQDESTLPDLVPSRKPIPLISRATSQRSCEPESSASRAGEPTSGETEIVPVYVASSRDLDNEFIQMLPAFEGKETEHNWLDREKAIMKIRGMLKGEVHSRYPEAFMSGLKNGFLEASLKALASLRTTVAANTCSFYGELAIALNTLLDPFMELLLGNLLKMAGFTKKIIANRSQYVVDVILEHTSCHPRQLLPILWNNLQDKNVQTRMFTVNHFKIFVEYHGLKSKHLIESAGGLEILEKSIKKGLSDPNPAVKEKARFLFWSFASVWKEKALSIMGTLDTIAKKQLQNVSPTSTEELGIIPQTNTSNTKKSSIATAIAASRAKAKQIATAPPTLRHQATSTSHAQHTQALRTVSPPIQSPIRSSSPVVSSPPSLHRRPSSPSSPSPASLTRLSHNSHLAHERQRPVSSGSSSSPPPSPTIASHGRRISSSRVTNSIEHIVSQHSRTDSHALASIGVGSRPTGTRRSSEPKRPQFSSNNAPERSDESMLMATIIPLPADSDIADDESVNLMNFSAPWESSKPATYSAASSSPTPTASRLSGIPHSVVEDALRARAAQAESAAEQLLELVEPDDDHHLSPIPPSLLPTNGNSFKPSSRSLVPPATPVNQTTSIMRQAALFQDSPVYKHTSPSLFDAIQERKHQTGWWLKRMSIINQSPPLPLDLSQKVQELEECMKSLDTETANLDILKRLTVLCHQNPIQTGASPPASPLLSRLAADKLPNSPSSPSPRVFKQESSILGDIWDNGKRSAGLFKSLCTFMRPNKDKSLLENGLFVLWELLPHLDGQDADILDLLLKLRYAEDFNVDEGTLTIRDAQVELMNERNFTLYGLSTMNICLKDFLKQPVPSFGSKESKIRTYAFGLITMAKFIIRLPADILEEEIPKIKQTLIEAYLNAEAMVRQAATTAITAAQVILQDETHLFALLEPLPDDKKNLLTYFFEKSNARGLAEQSHQDAIGSGMERLSKEMDRLDQRLSTPPRSRNT